MGGYAVKERCKSSEQSTYLVAIALSEGAGAWRLSVALTALGAGIIRRYNPGGKTLSTPVVLVFRFSTAYRKLPCVARYRCSPRKGGDLRLLECTHPASFPNRTTPPLPLSLSRQTPPFPSLNGFTFTPAQRKPVLNRDRQFNSILGRLSAIRSEAERGIRINASFDKWSRTVINNRKTSPLGRLIAKQARNRKPICRPIDWDPLAIRLLGFDVPTA